jgi:hypothetical protein
MTAGLICFVFAWLLFDRFADSDSVPTHSATGRRTAARRALNRRAKGAALGWKDFYFIAGGRFALGIKGALTVFIAYCCIALPWSHGARGNDQFAICGGLLTFFSAVFLGLCLALDASRIFRRERDEHTLSSLMMLPMSVERLAWDKMVGCLRTSIPPAIGLAAGLILIGIGIFKDLMSPHRYGGDSAVFYASAAFCHGVVVSALLPVFIAWLSLRMRWGALPVGVTIWFFGNWIGGGIAALIFREASIFILPVVAFILLAVMWNAIPRRLEQLAAEE